MGMQAFSQDGSHWMAWKECVIEDGIVYPSTKGPVITIDSLEKYEIFDYYSANPDRINPPIPEQLVSYILNDTKKDIQDICLYHLFAAIDCTDLEQVRRFVEVFGPPYLPPKHNDGLLSYALHVDPKLLPPIRLLGQGFPINLFVFEQREFIDLINKINLLHKADVSSLNNAAIYKLEQDIEVGFFQYIGLITPNLKFTRTVGQLMATPAWNWSVPNLISAMYFMLFMDLTTKGPPLKCANPGCNQFFFPVNAKKDTIYCSHTCYNRAHQRNNKARKKEVRALWRDGKSSEEITVTTGLDLERVSRWVGTFKR